MGLIPEVYDIEITKRTVGAIERERQGQADVSRAVRLRYCGDIPTLYDYEMG